MRRCPRHKSPTPKTCATLRWYCPLAAQTPFVHVDLIPTTCEHNTQKGLVSSSLFLISCFTALGLQIISRKSHAWYTYCSTCSLPSTSATNLKVNLHLRISSCFLNSFAGTPSPLPSDNIVCLYTLTHTHLLVDFFFPGIPTVVPTPPIPTHNSHY